jgi:hypothetical protein
MSARTSENASPEAIDVDDVGAGAATASVIDWPLEPVARRRFGRRVLVRARASQRDLIALAGTVVPLTVLHAWGMTRFPAFFDDEGAYVSQAFAVDKLHALAPYTYWYDHPPLGWILLGAWAKLVPVFTSSSFAVGASRTFALLLFAISAGLLYGIARRLALGPGLSALAVALFGLSPLALDYQRMVLLDNMAVPWLLAAFFLALSPRRRMAAYASSAVSFALAILTKETFLLFLPALALAVWSTCARSTRRFAIAVFATLLVCVAGFYPLFALLRGELLEGKHHTSLMYGIHFQLTRRGGGSILSAHSPTRDLIGTWLKLDPVLLTVAVVLIPILLAIRRVRWVGVALVVPVLMALRPGSYVPTMYVVGLLPFAALGLAAAAAEAVAASRTATSPKLLRAAFATAAVLLVAVPAGVAAPLWIKKDVSMVHTNDASADEKAVAWLNAHAPHNSRILVDATVWTDLVDRRFDRKRVVWFYKLDLDPAYRMPWWRFDYVVRSDLLAGNLNWLPRSRAVFEHSRLVAAFTTPDGRIEVRRVAARS